MSDWFLLNAKPAIFQVYHGKSNLYLNEMTMMSACIRSTCLVGFFIVLVYWNNNLQVDMRLYSDTLSWLWVNQTLLLLLNTACIAEKEQIPIIVSFVWLGRSLHPRSTILKVRTLTITPQMWFQLEEAWVSKENH